MWTIGKQLVAVPCVPVMPGHATGSVFDASRALESAAAHTALGVATTLAGQMLAEELNEGQPACLAALVSAAVDFGSGQNAVVDPTA